MVEGEAQNPRRHTPAQNKFNKKPCYLKSDPLMANQYDSARATDKELGVNLVTSNSTKLPFFCNFTRDSKDVVTNSLAV